MRTPIALTEYVWNEHRTDLSHLVPSIAGFSNGRDVATICGLTTSVADELPEFELCPACIAAADE